MTRDISSLPPEVLTHIFRFLYDGERLKASQVCKKWLQTIDCPELLCDIKIQFSGEVDEAVKLFSRMTRQFQWFSFCKIVIGDSVMEFLEKYSNQLVTLSFIDCAVGDGKLRSKLKGKKLCCDNLTTLHALNSDISSLFASLPNVTELELNMSFGLPDDVISELTKCLFKLKRLLLRNSTLVEEVCRILFAGQENPSIRAFPFSSIKLLIEENRTTLRHVDFAFLRFLPQSLLSISEIEGLKLRSMMFPGNLHSSYIHKFCKMQSSLIHLDLSFLLHDTDLTVCAVCNYLPNLQELIIKENPAIDRSISKIFQLQNLVELDVSGSMNISEFSYQEAVANLKTFKLKCLNLHFAKISDDSLFNLVKCNQNICYLDASGIRVSDETLNMICQKLTYLECLILESCPTISDSGLTGEFENYSDSITPTPLSNLKYLKVLTLGSNSLITNQGCIKAIRFRKLADLSLIACRGLILNNDFEMELKKQNPCLQNFTKLFLLPTDCSIPGVNLDFPDTHHTRTEIPSHTLTITSTTDSPGTRGPPKKGLNFLLDRIASATAPHLTDSPRSCPRDTGLMASPSTPGTSTQMDTDEDGPDKVRICKRIDNL
ncbi:f-box domain-containing protein [Trichonephila clavata]|uniref:F-box domain-containing protein n=1 Tax=Trichonephila clavata TaxID=2740835 RepID=A0A8X6FEH5_TRICU|nr:f-box domain-containing protein [Trichonephila clavata]